MMNSEQNAVSQEVRNTPFRKLQICILILIVRHWANIMRFVAVRVLYDLTAFLTGLKYHTVVNVRAGWNSVAWQQSDVKTQLLEGH